MSLSKYYKSPKTFQAEKIVQRQDPEQGWQSLPQSDKEGFKSHKLEPEQIQQRKTPEEINPPVKEQSQDIDSNQTSVHTVPPASPEDRLDATTTTDQQNVEHQEDSAIDLSKYVERSELDSLTDEAFRQGLDEGRLKAEEDYGSATKALLSVCQQLDSIRDTIIGNSGRELQDFALAIAQRILRISVKEQDHTIIATIDEALHRAVRSDEFTIFIHPEDFEIVKEKSEELITGITGLNNLIIKIDSTVESGGARIESENCTIDATLAGQFDVIQEEIRRKSQKLT